MQFVGYHLSGAEVAVPVAAGPTYDETLRKTIRRVLGAGISDGEIAVQERPDLTAEEFAAGGAATDVAAVKYGLRG